MLMIDKLTLSLPRALRHRADRIAHLVGESLAGSDGTTGDARLPSLTVPPVSVHPRQSDREIAGCIARSIVAALPTSRPRAAPGTGEQS